MSDGVRSSMEVMFLKRLSYISSNFFFVYLAKAAMKRGFDTLFSKTHLLQAYWPVTSSTAMLVSFGWILHFSSISS